MCGDGGLRIVNRFKLVFKNGLTKPLGELTETKAKEIARQEVAKGNVLVLVRITDKEGGVPISIDF